MITGRAIILAGGTSAPAIFGDGSDGALVATTNLTWNADTEDTGMIVKQFESLTIAQGVTVAAGNRNYGMIIRVKGDCTINGTLENRMSPKTILDSDNVDFSAYPLSMLNGTAGAGGAGGQSGNYSSGQDRRPGGTGMAGRFYGGGYSGGGAGGYSNSDRSGASAPAEGSSAADITTAISNIFVGGAANSGNGAYGGGGGGAKDLGSYTGGTGGNGPGGNGGDAYKGEYSNRGGGGGGAGNYGGGVIILLVGGNLTVAGTISCAGGNGGNGGGGAVGGGGGGGGGGGRIFICHKGTLSNNGTLNVNAGAGGGAGTRSSGGAKNNSDNGTAGTIGTLDVKTYDEFLQEDIA